MLALSKLLQAQPARSHAADLVDSLLQRVLESALAQDRNEALVQLRDVVTTDESARVAFGSVGLPAMVTLVRESRDDTEQLRTALECLSAAVGPAEGSASTSSAVNAEQLLRSAECVPELLGLLDEEPVGVADFFVRFYTLDVLKGLLAANVRLLQEAVLSAPLGVVRLMGLLSEERDALRNEALLLLQQLVVGNVELQKMAAFEGAFDRAMSILREEGLVDGGIVVQDCLQLLLNLLRGNSSNQLMFREMGFLAQLLGLLAPAAEGAAGLGPGSQPCHNLAAALQVVAVLITPPVAPESTGMHSQCAQNKELLAQQQLPRLLHSLTLGSAPCPDARVRAQALACLAGMVAAPQPAVQLDEPSLDQLVWAALHGGEEEERVAADAVLEAAWVGDPAAQSAAVLWLFRRGGDHELVRALGCADVRLSGRAASCLSHIVRGNADARTQLAQQLVPQLAQCTQQLAGVILTPPGSWAQDSSLLLAKLMVCWLPECAPAVLSFLQAAAATPFLVNVVNGALRPDAALRGLLAVVLGLCAVVRSAPHPAPLSSGANVPTGAMLVDVIVSQIGAAEFSALLSGLGQQLLASGYGSNMQPGHATAGGLVSSPSFCAYATQLAADVSRSLSSLAAGTPLSQPAVALSMPPRQPAVPLPPPPLQPAMPLPMPPLQPAVPLPPPPLQPAVPLPPPPLQPAVLLPTPPVVTASQPEAAQLRAPWQPAPAPGPPVYQPADTCTPPIRGPSAPPNVPTYAELRTNAEANGGLAHPSPQLTSRANGDGTDSQFPTENGVVNSGPTSSVPATNSTNTVDSEEIRKLREQLHSALQEAEMFKQEAHGSQQEAARLGEGMLKLESELEGLSNAYAMLEAHSRDLQSQLELAHESTKAERCSAVQEDDDALDDLLVCLGREEAKVARLVAYLSGLGIDPSTVIGDLDQEE